jgi:hypothetical protein
LIGPALQEIRNVARAATPTHEHLRNRLVAVFVITLVVDAVATVAIFYLERHAKGTEIKTIGSSLFWVSAQLTTVSSQLPNPLTPAARAIDIFLELYAITVVASVAGMFGSFFHRRSVERAGHPEPPGEVA